MKVIAKMAFAPFKRLRLFCLLEIPFQELSNWMWIHQCSADGVRCLRVLQDTLLERMPTWMAWPWFWMTSHSEEHDHDVVNSANPCQGHDDFRECISPITCPVPRCAPVFVPLPRPRFRPAIHVAGCFRLLRRSSNPQPSSAPPSRRRWR